MEDKQSCIIPRNLNKDDIIKLSFGLKLKILDMPIIGCGGGLAYLLGQNHSNILVKTFTYLVFVGSSYIITKLNYEDQDVPELAVNTVMYHGKKINYNKIKVGEQIDGTKTTHIQKSDKCFSN